MRSLEMIRVAGVLSLGVLAVGCGGGGTDAPAVGPAAVVAPVSGTGASVTAGASTSIALTAKVSDAGGHPVPGASVSWGTASGTISPAASTSDGSGQATAQWTPGKTAGVQSATASVSGAGTATFTATVAPGALAKITLTPATNTLTAVGATSQITATGFDAFDNAITPFTPTFTIDNPQVATVNASGLVTAVANGTTTVRATSGSISGTATVTVSIAATGSACAGVTMTLAPGTSQTLTGAAASQFCVNGAAGAEFVAIPYYGTGNGGTGSGGGTFTPAPSLNLTFNPLTNTTVSGPPTPSIGANLRSRASVSAGADAGADATLMRDVAWEARFRERVRKQFGPLGRQARDRARGSSALRKNITISPVMVGDPMQLNVNVNESCSNPQLVPATVKAVGTRAIVVEDDRDPAGFTQLDYQSFADIFDGQIWTVDTDNFGPPTDIDNNGHVILFFTRKVNELTPAGSSSFVGGFFFGRDLFLRTDPCTSTTKVVGSNQAEMFYLLAPDPEGKIVNGNVRTVQFVKSITAGTIAHEFQHLINFGYRLYDPNVLFTDENFPEQTFLDEGLAHIAEELNYYAATQLLPRSNIEAATLTGPDASYRAFAQQNAIRFREYLKNPDKYPPYSELADTSLAVRGGIWSFLRYAADRKGGTEKSTWLSLARPDKNVGGMTNLANTFGNALAQMRDWTVANYLDDAPNVSPLAPFLHPSWNTRSVETFVNGPGTSASGGTVFPLKVTPLLSAPVSMSLADGGAGYLRFGVTQGAVGGATVSATTPLNSFFSITVVRTK